MHFADSRGTMCHITSAPSYIRTVQRYIDKSSRPTHIKIAEVMLYQSDGNPAHKHADPDHSYDMQLGPGGCDMPWLRSTKL
jgi:hypothetical protein